jgi:membrane protein implicated in regulation of membrane protease activity
MLYVALIAYFLWTEVRHSPGRLFTMLCGVLFVFCCVGAMVNTVYSWVGVGIVALVYLTTVRKWYKRYTLTGLQNDYRQKLIDREGIETGVRTLSRATINGFLYVLCAILWIGFLMRYPDKIWPSLDKGNIVLFFKCTGVYAIVDIFTFTATQMLEWQRFLDNMIERPDSRNSPFKRDSSS